MDDARSSDDRLEALCARLDALAGEDGRVERFDYMQLLLAEPEYEWASAALNAHARLRGFELVGELYE